VGATRLHCPDHSGARGDTPMSIHDEPKAHRGGKCRAMSSGVLVISLRPRVTNADRRQAAEST